jgi:hypothetical protein
LEKAPNRSSQSQVRYLTGLFAFNHDEFVIIMRYANTSYRATILVSYSLQQPNAIADSDGSTVSQCR